MKSRGKFLNLSNTFLNSFASSFGSFFRCLDNTSSTSTLLFVNRCKDRLSMLEPIRVVSIENFT